MTTIRELEPVYVASPGVIIRTTEIVYGVGVLHDATFTAVLPSDPDAATAVRTTHTGCDALTDAYLVSWYALQADVRDWEARVKAL